MQKDVNHTIVDSDPQLTKIRQSIGLTKYYGNLTPPAPKNVWGAFGQI